MTGKHIGIVRESLKKKKKKKKNRTNSRKYYITVLVRMLLVARLTEQFGKEKYYSRQDITRNNQC